MFYHFILPLQDEFSFLRIFQYITFRSAYAVVTSLIIAFIFTPYIIRWLQRLKFGENIREDGPQSHMTKLGTPTMGGVAILLPMFISSLVWANFSNHYVIILLTATLIFGGIGFADDYMKTVLHISKGMSARLKLYLQFVSAFVVVLLLFVYPSNQEISSKIFLPFVNKAVLDLGAVSVPVLSQSPINLTWLYVIFGMFVIVGTSNAVNLSDGLDGLAIGNSLIVVSAFTLLVYVSGHIKIANYLLIPFVPHAGELAVLLASFVGASLGFLWFNANPAQLFMGDTGSLAIGGMIGTISLMIKKEFLLLIIGGVFVIEALSVIIQVVYYKRTGKRIFKMSPIHHHFELSGWPETKVVTRFWIIGIILALIAVSSLKIR